MKLYHRLKQASGLNLGGLLLMSLWVGCGQQTPPAAPPAKPPPAPAAQTAPQQQAVTDPFDELDALLLQRKAPEAVAQVQALLDHDNPTWQSIARQRYPECLAEAVRQALNTGDLAQAQDYLRRLEAWEHGLGRDLISATQAYAHDLEQGLLSGDAGSQQAALQVLQEGPLLGPRQRIPFGQLLRPARTVEPELLLSSVLAASRVGGLESLIGATRRLSPELLRATRQLAIDQQQPDAALILGIALVDPRDDQQAGLRQQMIDGFRPTVAAWSQAPATDHAPWATLELISLRRLLGAYQLELATEELAAQLKIARWFRQRRDFGAAQTHYQRAATQSVAAWLAELRQTEQPLMEQLTADLRQHLDDLLPRADTDTRLHALQRWAVAETIEPPARRDIRAEAADMQLEWAAALLASDPDDAIERLLPLLRNHGEADTLLERLRPAAQDALRVALHHQDLGALSRLAGFYVSELAREKDPFRQELATILSRSIDGLNADQQRRRLFLLTLLADLLPEGDEAAAVRKEAVQTAQDLRQAISPSQEEHPSKPLGLDGMSIMRLTNATSYHLLLYLTGTEAFFVRVDPLSSAAVVLRDGYYQSLVVVTSDDVRPYHGQMTLTSALSENTYYIQREGWDHTQETRQIGDWTLLRVPPGEDPVALQPLVDQGPTNSEPSLALDNALSDDLTTARESINALILRRQEQAAFQAVAEAARTHPNRAIRKHAADSLVPFRRYHDVWPVWREALWEEEEGFVRKAALESALKAEASDSRSSFFSDFAGEPWPDLQATFLRYLEQRPAYQDVSLQPVVLQLYQQAEEDSLVQRLALQRLAYYAHPLAMKEAATRLVSTDRRELFSGIRLLRQCPDAEAAVPLLLKAIQSNATFRPQLAAQLASYRSPRAEAALLQLLQRADNEIRLAILKGLRETPEPPGAKLLAAVHALAHEEALARQVEQVKLKWPRP